MTETNPTPLCIGTFYLVVNGILYLALDVSGFMTGITLFMNAGRPAHNTEHDEAP